MDYNKPSIYGGSGCENLKYFNQELPHCGLHHLNTKYIHQHYRNPYANDQRSLTKELQQQYCTVGAKINIAAIC